MSLQRLVQEQRKNSQICIQILLRCKTRQQTIEAFDQVARLLRAYDSPVAVAAEVAHQLSHTTAEASVLQARDEFIA